MGADEKHDATYHGVSHNPDTYLVRTVYAGASPVPSYEDRETAFNCWLETVRAEAKAEAWGECARSIVYEDGTPVEIASITNPYKEQS